MREEGGKGEGGRERERERERKEERGGERGDSLALFCDSILKRLSADSASVAMAFSLTILRNSLIPENRQRTPHIYNMYNLIYMYPTDRAMKQWQWLSLTKRLSRQFLVQTVWRRREQNTHSIDRLHTLNIGPPATYSNVHTTCA